MCNCMIPTSDIEIVLKSIFATQSDVLLSQHSLLLRKKKKKKKFDLKIEIVGTVLLYKNSTILKKKLYCENNN